MKIISRAEALAKGLKRYFTGKPCKHGHVAERWVSSLNCLECAHLLAHTPEALARASAYGKARRLSDPARANRRSYESKKRNRPKYLTLRFAYKSKNRARWAKCEAMKGYHWLYQYLSNGFHGVDFEIDHIVPFKGEKVCGLHVENNLCVVHRAENQRKRNKWFDANTFIDQVRRQERQRALVERFFLPTSKEKATSEMLYEIAWQSGVFDNFPDLDSLPHGYAKWLQETGRAKPGSTDLKFDKINWSLKRAWERSTPNSKNLKKVA